MEVQTVKYKLHEKDYFFRLTNRSKIQFCELAGYDIPSEQAMTFQDILMVVYVGTVAGMKEKEQEFTLTWQQWLDYTDCDEQFMLDLFDSVNPEKKKDSYRRTGRKAEYKRVL